MKKVTLAIAMAALVLFAGCKKDTTTMTSTLKASIEQNQGDGSKTSLVPISDTDAEIRWTEGDQILVTNGTSTKTFTLTNGAGSTSGTFTCSGEYELGTNNMAVYPATGTFSGNTLSYTLPAEQNGGVGTFANGANPMLAVSDNDNLTFKSLCGVLGLSLTGDNIAITAIEIVDNGTGNNSMLHGAFTANCTASESEPVLAYAGTDGTNSVRLNCATTLNAEPQEFYIVLPVGTLASANGFTMNLYNGADLVFSKTRGAALEMQYNTVRKMSTFNVTLAPVVTAPEVTTGTATAVTIDGATCAGTVNSDGNGTVSAWGITYSTTDGFNGTDGTPVPGGDMDGAGDFSASLIGLDSGTTYYYRAYATNEVGTTYGDIESFTTTAIVAPTVTTVPTAPTDPIVAGTTTPLVSAGVAEGGTMMYKVTTENTQPSSTTGFSAMVPTAETLSAGIYYVWYYVQGDATHSDSEISTTAITVKVVPAAGAIGGKFSVSATQQVYFSQGNLWATTSDLGSTWTWSFAENQYDYVGNAAANNTINGNGTVSTNGSIDLFCWSTNASFYGINNSTDDYGYSGTFIEWGNIAISNGGNTENSGWRTLTINEWGYLFNSRTDAASKKGLGSVNGVNGLILLPDEWTLPDGLTFTAVNNSWANVYTTLQWEQMEANGAIFLPALGARSGLAINNLGARGDYWSSSAGTNNANARSMYFQINKYQPSDTSYRRSGRGVRLVRDVE
jgi:hypothetical protein